MFFKDNACGICVPKDFQKPRRWFDNDIEFAKLLKQYGAVAVRKSEFSPTPYWQSKVYLGIVDGGNLPKDSFKSLTNNEVVDLDDIIDEGY